LASSGSATRTSAPSVRGTIDPERILKHWDDLLRVAGSLKLGWVTASLFIGKLQSYRRKNALTRALQEYGQMNRTIDRTSSSTANANPHTSRAAAADRAAELEQRDQVRPSSRLTWTPATPLGHGWRSSPRSPWVQRENCCRGSCATVARFTVG
jgi:hypothetical protein